MTRPLRNPGDRHEITRGRRRMRDLERRYKAERFLPVVFDGIGAPLSTGIKGDVPVHFDAIIIGWRLLADQVGDLVVDIWKTDYTGFPPTITDTITASDLPTLSGAQKNDDTTLTDWTTIVHAGDCLRYNINSAATITRATLTLVFVETLIPATS